jgi:hypothetical protein
MKRNRRYFIAALTLAFTLTLAFPLSAYASTDTTPPTLTATLSGSALTVNAKDDASGVAAIYIDGHRVNALTGGIAKVNLKDYADAGAKVTVYAVDGAGNRSKETSLDNPYYKKPVALAPAEAQPAEANSGGAPAGSSSRMLAPESAPETSSSAQTDADVSVAGSANGPAASTPNGTGTVIGSATDADGKEFYTITTEAGNIFYLVIDKQKAGSGVYFLNAVTEADLAALAEKAIENSGIPSIGSTPQPEPEPEPETKPEPAPEPAPKKGKEVASAGTIIFALLAVATLCGAGYYVKVLRPRKRHAEEVEDEDSWDSFFPDEGDDDGDFDVGEFLPEEETDEPDKPGEDTEEHIAEPPAYMGAEEKEDED